MGAQISRLVYPRHNEATHKVFDTTELLELIMLKLGGYHNILVARAVCKHWQAFFERSLAIKRVTFRAPGDPRLTGIPLLSQRLRDTLTGPVADRDEEVSIYLKKARELGCEDFVFHPKSEYPGLRNPGCTHVHDDGTLNGLTEEVPFCRSMYVTQPPQMASILSIEVRPGCDDSQNIACEAGETFGSMADKLHEHDVQGLPNTLVFDFDGMDDFYDSVDSD